MRRVLAMSYSVVFTAPGSTVYPPSVVRALAVPSRCPFRGLGKGQAAQVVRSFGSMAACCRTFASVLKLESKTDSGADVLEVEVPARQAPCNSRPHHAGIHIKPFRNAVVDHGGC